MSNYIETLRKIIGGSIEYSFSGNVLKITSYYTGESIKLDLSLIDEEIKNITIEQLINMGLWIENSTDIV